MRIFVSLFCLLILSCSSKEKSFRFATGPFATSYSKVGKSIAETVGLHTPYEFDLLQSPAIVQNRPIHLSSNNNCRLLLNGEADFAIAQNDAALTIYDDFTYGPEDSPIQSVIPLYREVFFLIYKKKLQPRSLRELIRNRRVSIGPRNSGTASFALALLKHFELDTTDFKPIHINSANNILSDSVDVCCTLTGFDNPRITKMLEDGGKIYSFGNPQVFSRGSVADGFCLQYPAADAYIIPRRLYGDAPVDPILTVSVDAVLLARKAVADQVVYDILEVLFDNKHIMMAKLKNHLLSNISESFDVSSLAFPLHKGARQYLKRNEPTYLERNAETFGFFLSIFLAVVTALVGVTRWQHRRRKNRIDVYYEQVLVVQNAWAAFSSFDECDKAILQLRRLRQNAFQLLIKDKLEANESFRIFITLLNDTLRDVRGKKSELTRAQ